MAAERPPSTAARKAAATKKAAAEKADAAKKAPPEKAAAAKKVAPKIGAGGTGPGRPSKAALQLKISDSLSRLGGALQVAGTLGGNEAHTYAGKVIEHQAADLAAEVYKLAETSPGVRKLLEQLYKGSSNLDSLTAVVGTLVPVLVAYGRLPRSAMTLPGVGGNELIRAIGEPPAKANVTPLRPVQTPAAATTAPRPWAADQPAEPATLWDDAATPVDSADPEPEPEPAPWTGPDLTTPVGVGQLGGLDAGTPGEDQGFTLGWPTE